MEGKRYSRLSLIVLVGPGYLQRIYKAKYLVVCKRIGELFKAIAMEYG